MSRNSLRRAVTLAATALTAYVAAFGCAKLRPDSDPATSGARDSIVRVRVGRTIGAGFFVEQGAGPTRSAGALVATAFHVVASGQPVIVEREVAVKGHDFYTLAYPDVEVVGVDTDADLALLRIRNLSPDVARVLALNTAPQRASKVTSWGFPATSLTGDRSTLDLTSKSGEISNFVKLPVRDPLYGRVVRENAVNGLIVSVDLEPGFSGGPTIDEAGRVVGVNVLKDDAHRGQNAVVTSAALDVLVRTAGGDAAIDAAAVADALARIEREYLRLPIGERHEVFPTQYLRLSDVARVRDLAASLRTLIWQGGTGATVGMILGKMPGDGLPTYWAQPTRTRVGDCERASGADFLADTHGRGVDACRDLEVRPLAWDMAAASLHWEDTGPREWDIAKVEAVDPEAGLFRAQVSVRGQPRSFPVYVARERGQLSLSVTDEHGRFYAFVSPQGATEQEFSGHWSRDVGRTTDSEQIARTDREYLDVSVESGGRVRFNQRFRHEAQAPPGKRFTCDQLPTVLDEVLQEFAGVVDGGVVEAKPSRRMQRSSDSAAWCPTKCGTLCAQYSEDTSAVFKRVGADLVMIRTNGRAFPESARFKRDADAAK